MSPSQPARPATAEDAQRAHKLRALQEAIAAVGQEGTGRLFDAQEETAMAAVRQRALRLLDHRARSRHELHTRLREHDYPEPVIDKVLAQLEESRLIDDRTFAQEWVRQRRNRRGKSTRMLDVELEKKGISATVRREVLADIDDEDEQRLAAEVAAKKARSLTTPPADYAQRTKALRRIAGALARRGFSESVALPAATQALDERVAQLQQEA
ncbi:regulatory protein RecX [Corynebacterium uberis]|uniref:regulatory protein RecX n=1 Tax=Corynebacterium TaxID=1716 RepID=UPI001D0BBE31|nr:MULTISPECIES: regulatory protein RecX [Corynebacterium]MCZ9308482.1 recombination regulator RecX [Corynebacterium sp. c6VSa_13]UDL74143.1 recombination regulator RecX [Corynebacterium uberis]UDL74973.1 recombination regulator RecX [Corynebacterium uberis]UDL77188.1 recombination regulator RecX [Corynebacterium uberis]UDL79470.1 recombination regulator RecX [Corynebacterium uberis]